MRAGARVGAVVVGLVLAWCAGCEGYPKDPMGTLERVEGGTLRVGVAGPGPADLTDVEREIVAALAEELGARVEWVRDPVGDLMRGLGAGRVDVVIGGIARSDPWSGRVAMSRAYGRSLSTDGETLDLAIAAPRGENAFLLQIDRLIAEQGVSDAP